MKRVFACLLAVSLVLPLCGAAALAEGQTGLSDDISRVEVKFGNRVYSCVGTVDEIKAQGLNFGTDEIEAGYRYTVDNGRQTFQILMDAHDRETATAENTFACGYRLTAEDNANAEIYGGVVIGEATRADVRDILGAPDYEGSDYDRYNAWKGNIILYIYYESDAANAKIKSAEMTSYILTEYGAGLSEQAGIQEENLPDPNSFAFSQFILDGKFYDGSALKLSDLTANGWRVGATDTERTLSPNSGFSIWGYVIGLYNGESMIEAFVYNGSDESNEIPLIDGDVMYVGASAGECADIVIADGLTVGSTIDDVRATFGTNCTEKPDEDKGWTYYEYTTNNTRNGFTADADGKIIYIRVQP